MGVGRVEFLEKTNKLQNFQNFADSIWTFCWNFLGLFNSVRFCGGKDPSCFCPISECSWWNGFAGRDPGTPSDLHLEAGRYRDEIS